MHAPRPLGQLSCLGLAPTLLLLAACAGSAPVEDPPSFSPQAPSAELLAQGQAAWQQGMCSKCHEDDGTGGARAPDLTDDVWLHTDGSVASIRALLVTGVPRERLVDPDRPFSMNPVPRLVPSEADLDALAIYVTHLSLRE